MGNLVDSDILIDLSRGSVSASEYVDSIGDWSLSIVSGLELLAGAKGKREIAEIDIFIRAYPTVSLVPEIGQLAFNLMKTYSKANGLDPCDALIAATRYSRAYRLSTKNEKHFRNIGGLEIDVPDY